MRKLGADRRLLTVSTLYFYANCLGIIYTWRQQETKLLDRGLLCKGQLLTQRLTVFSLTDPRMKPLCRGRCRRIDVFEIEFILRPPWLLFPGVPSFPPFALFTGPHTCSSLRRTFWVSVPFVGFLPSL